jgi:hypothetical protein
MAHIHSTSSTYPQIQYHIIKIEYYRIEGQNLLKLNKDILSSTFCIESNIIKKKIINCKTQC